MIYNAVSLIILYNGLKCALPTDFLNVRELMEDVVSEMKSICKKAKLDGHEVKANNLNNNNGLKGPSIS
jgi:hypothetical protein